MDMTKTQAKLIETMKAAIAEGTWTAIRGDTIRYTETRETPEINQGRGFGRWPEETYTRHLFLTFTGRGVVLGEARAPWVERRDSHITYKRAFEILADPADQF